MFVAAVSVVTGLVGVVDAGAATVARPADPVVLTGAQLPKLVNTTRAPIVGFRWTGSAWAQFPVQIDERAVVNFGKIYNRDAVHRRRVRVRLERAVRHEQHP